MNIKYNENLHNSCFTRTSLGILPNQYQLEYNFLDRDKVSYHRLGQLIYTLEKLKLRTSSNIVCLDKDALIPCPIQSFKQASGLQDSNFNKFVISLTESGILKIKDGIIFINPLYLISEEMDYIREDLADMFPKQKHILLQLNRELLKDYIEEN